MSRSVTACERRPAGRDRSTVFETRTRTDRANLENLRAQFNEQEANLVLARQQLQRNQNLFKAKIVSQDTLQTSEAQLAPARRRPIH
jgi:macrolide-specific efflux system membrane fusion protein